MRLRTFVLYVVLLSLLGVATVMERSRQTVLAYELGELKLRERSLQDELHAAQVELAVRLRPAALRERLSVLDRPVSPLRPVEADVLPVAGAPRMAWQGTVGGEVW